MAEQLDRAIVPGSDETIRIDDDYSMCGHLVIQARTPLKRKQPDLIHKRIGNRTNNEPGNR